MTGRVAAYVVAALVALPGAAPLLAQAPAGSRWWDDVDRVDGFLRQGRVRAAARELGRLRPEVMRASWREPDLGRVLSELAFLAAVVHANRGEPEAAVWEWYAAQALERAVPAAGDRSGLAERDLRPYGRASELLAGHPLREQGEPPAGEEVQAVLPGDDFHPAVPPEHTLQRLENVNVTRTRLPAVTFEVWVDRDGRVLQPVVASPWSPPILLQWGLDNLRAMPRFRPARLRGEPVGTLEEVELDLASAPSRF